MHEWPSNFLPSAFAFFLKEKLHVYLRKADVAGSADS